MRILATGSSGFIARFLIPQLLSMGHEVIGVDIRLGPQFGDGFHFIQGNILDPDILNGSMGPIDLVIHLAAEHKDFGVPDSLYHKVNVDGTVNLLRCATRCAVRKFLLFSSVAVYGTTSVPTYEGLMPSPDLPYGASKLLAERAVLEWTQVGGNRASIIIRPTVVFGPFNYANMYRLIQAVAKRRYITVGDGRNIKSVAYVENLTSATVFLIDRMKAGVDTFNYSDTPHFTTNELVRCIAGQLGLRVPLVRIPKALALTCALPFDALAKATGRDLPLTAKRIEKFTLATHHLAEKIRDQGYNQPYALEEGIHKTIEWYLQRSAARDSRPENA
jgi:nucleoside-diphosphate-sugar epimerase